MHCDYNRVNRQPHVNIAELSTSDGIPHSIGSPTESSGFESHSPRSTLVVYSIDDTG